MASKEGQTLARATDIEGDTPMHYAVEHGHHMTVAALFEVLGISPPYPPPAHPHITPHLHHNARPSFQPDPDVSCDLPTRP